MIVYHISPDFSRGLGYFIIGTVLLSVIVAILISLRDRGELYPYEWF